jgi:hypothetical protein
VLLLAELANPVPTELVAVTVNVYAVPPVKPDTVIVPDPACDNVAVTDPGLDVAIYFVIVAPPLLAGAVNATVADVAPVAVAVPIVGAPGATFSVIELLAELAALVPIEFVAVTVNV